MWVNVADGLKEDPPSKAEIRQVIDYTKRAAKIRFYADENFPEIATRILRRYGAQVVTVAEVGLRMHPDENHAEYALRKWLHAGDLRSGLPR